MRSASGPGLPGRWWLAGDAVRKVEGSAVIGSGSGSLDGLLGGGYKRSKVTEVYGRSNSGKSQLAMQAVLMASRAEVRSLFIDTEGTFRPERLEGIAEARGWPSKGLLERVVYLRVDSSSEQMEVVRRMSSREQTESAGLVVIDTLTRNFSLEMPGRSNVAIRQGALDVHLSEVARDAFINDRAYVLTNRVTFGNVHDVNIGGKTVEQMLDLTVRLDREGDSIRATRSEGQSATLKLGTEGAL